MSSIRSEIVKRLIGLASSYENPYPVQVRGEENYQENLEEICGYYDEDEGYNEDDHMAALYLENENPHDPGNAVRVQIDDKVVGYLSKLDAAFYRKRLTELVVPENPIGICGASIRGGFMKRDEKAPLGVRLDFKISSFTLVPLKIRN